MPEAESFGMRLRRIREEKGIKQKQLADLIGVSQNTVSVYETGRSIPDVETAGRIAVALGVSLDLLCGITVSKEPESISAVQWLEYLDRLLQNPPKRIGADRNNAYFLTFEYNPDNPTHPDKVGGLYFYDSQMANFFNAYYGVNGLRRQGIPEKTLYSLKKTLFNDYAKFFTPGYDEESEFYASFAQENDECTMGLSAEYQNNGTETDNGQYQQQNDQQPVNWQPSFQKLVNQRTFYQPDDWKTRDELHSDQREPDGQLLDEQPPEQHEPNWQPPDEQPPY